MDCVGALRRESGALAESAASRSTTPKLVMAGSSAEVLRVPGIGIYYTDYLLGVPAALLHVLWTLPVVHEVRGCLQNALPPLLLHLL